MMSTYTVVVLVVCVLVAAVTGDGCDNIEGLWVNQHGSKMNLIFGPEGKLTGTYTTTVESDEGDAGDKNEPIIGVAESNTPGVTFGFSVMWRKGLSTTVWTGQCHMCDGVPTIMTSWLLRTTQTEYGERWKAIQIGQDYFTRTVATTQHQQKPRMLDIVTSDGFLEGLAYNKRHRREAMVSAAADTVTCEIPGEWYNAIGSKLDAQHLGNSILMGDYWTAQEMQAKKLTGKHTGVHGQYNDEMHNHTMSYFVSWNKGESVTGWVGQCHVCEKANSTEMEAVLETTWFHRVAVTSCHANWRSTLYGQTTFRREVQRPVAPGDDVVGEFGEEVALCPPPSSAAATFRPLSALTGLVLLYVLSA